MDIDSGEIVKAPAPRGRGRPRKQPRETAVHEPTREPTRPGAEVFVGRNGEQLTRSRMAGSDPFAIPQEIIPKGWEYQWNVVSVVGNTDVVLDQVNGMYENGWRPVPAERHPGRFVARTKKGDIIRGGQRLEERPKAMSERARAEEIAVAKRLINDRNDSLKLSGVKNSMPDGFEMSRKYRGTGGDIKMTIDPGLDIPAPSSNYQLVDPGE